MHRYSIEFQILSHVGEYCCLIIIFKLDQNQTLSPSHPKEMLVGQNYVENTTYIFDKIENSSMVV